MVLSVSSVAESAASVNASLYIIQSLCLCDVRVKLEAVRQVILTTIYIYRLHAQGFIVFSFKLIVNQE